LLVLVAGCQLAQVDVDVQEVHLTYHDVSIRDAHGASAAHTDFTFDDLGALQKIVDDGGQLSFVGAELMAASGIDSLTFVDGMDIALGSGDPKADLPSMMLTTCNGNCKKHDNVLSMPADGDVDATPYISTGKLLLGIGVRGKLPVTDWAVDLDIAMKGSLEYSF
jgi:hypothetical protein